MITSQNFTLYVCSFLAFAGILFSVIAYRSWKESYDIHQNGIRTEGVVVELIKSKSRKSKSTAKAPVVRFKTQDGQVITHYSSTYTTPCSYSEGQIVPIWYMPNEPMKATIDGSETYILPIVFGFFGVLATLFSLPILLKMFVRLVYQ